MQTFVALAVCVCPLLPLFDISKGFAPDWFNHLWMMEYFGEYLKTHGAPPGVFVTDAMVGVPLPLFYAGKFYTLAGLLCACLGSALAFRLIALLVMLLQYCHVMRATRIAGGGWLVATSIAALVTWAIYPLTNLYNRGALTEFVAVCFLTASASSLFALATRIARGRRSYYDAVAFGLFYVMAAVTHPLTAEFGAVFLLIIGGFSFLAQRSLWLLGVGGVNAVASSLVLAPWIYLLHRFSGFLSLTDPALTSELFRARCFFPQSIDNIWSRLCPLPLDLDALKSGLAVSTPYLDAQILIPLLLLLLLLVLLGLKSSDRKFFHPWNQGLFFSALSVSTLFLIVSIDPPISAAFGGIFDVLQFPYRLVSYVNLGILLAVLATISMMSRKVVLTSRRPPTLSVCTICLTVSLCALLLKLIHAEAFVSTPDSTRENAWQPGVLGPGPHLTSLPESFYAAKAYSVTAGAKEVPPQFAEKMISFVPSPRLGSVEPVRLDLSGPTMIVTNVQPFPWNGILIDGVRRSSTNLFFTADLVVGGNGFPGRYSPETTPLKRSVPSSIAVLAPMGKHVLTYRFLPDRKWKILEILSWVTLVAWISVWLLIPFTRGPIRNLFLDRTSFSKESPTQGKLNS
jgi:hypothetical protein